MTMLYLGLTMLTIWLVGEFTGLLVYNLALGLALLRDLLINMIIALSTAVIVIMAIKALIIGAA